MVKHSVVEQEGDGTRLEDHKKVMARVKAAEKWRRDRKSINDGAFANARRLYMGQHWQSGSRMQDLFADDVNSKITVNGVGSMVNDYVPFLVRQNPSFLTNPRPKADSSEAIDEAKFRAKLVSYLLAYYWEEYLFQVAYKLSVHDGCTFGHGIVETGWTLELDESKNPEKDGELNLDDYVRLDQPYCKRINPLRFHFDPTASDHTLRTARWCAVAFFSPIADIVNNSLYNKKLRKLISNGEETVTSAGSYLNENASSALDTDPELQEIVHQDGSVGDLGLLYKIWDKKFKTFYVFADGIDTPLLERPADEQQVIDGFFPFVMWKFMHIPDEPFSMGIPGLTADQALERDRIRTTEFLHRRKYGTTKYVYMDGTIDDEELTKLTSADTDVVKFNGGGDLKDVLVAFNTPNISQDNYNLDKVIENDQRMIVGLDALASGGSLPGRTSAREIDARQRNTSLKLEERKGAVDRFALGIARQLLQHMQNNLSTDQVVEIAGESGAAAWKPLSIEEIKMDYDLEVVSSSKPPADPEAEMAQWSQLWERMVQAVPILAQAGWEIDIPRMTQIMLEKMGTYETEGLLKAVPKPPTEQDGGGGPPAANPDVPSQESAIQQSGVNGNSLLQGAQG